MAAAEAGRKALRLSEFAARRLLAVDIGVTYSGLAVCTSRLTGVQPYGYIERQPAKGRFALQSKTGWTWLLRIKGGSTSRFEGHQTAIEAVIRDQRLGGVVLGVPYAPGESSPSRTHPVFRAAKELQTAWEGRFPVLLWDESFTTRLAIGPMAKAGRGSSTKWSHAAAACVLLNEVVETGWRLGDA